MVEYLASGRSGPGSSFRVCEARRERSRSWIPLPESGGYPPRLSIKEPAHALQGGSLGRRAGADGLCNVSIPVLSLPSFIMRSLSLRMFTFLRHKYDGYPVISSIPLEFLSTFPIRIQGGFPSFSGRNRGAGIQDQSLSRGTAPSSGAALHRASSRDSGAHKYLIFRK